MRTTNRNVMAIAAMLALTGGAFGGEALAFRPHGEPREDDPPRPPEPMPAPSLAVHSESRAMARRKRQMERAKLKANKP